jgi:hypothetical protein
MSHAVNAQSQSYRIANIVLVISFMVASYAAWQGVVKLSNDDCVSVTETLATGATQTIRSCS